MILEEIVFDKEKKLKAQKLIISENEMKRKAEKYNRQCISLFHALKKPGISIIGEFKCASPSLGTIPQTLVLPRRIQEYDAAVDAISCLTEEDHFHGSAEYLINIRNMTSLPILRKDFMIDEYQFYESKLLGADAVLLIATVLDDERLKEFYKLAGYLGLDALVEVHNEEEMERACKLNAKIIGVNNRNLKDFTVSLNPVKKLRNYVSENKAFVAESGIMTDQDVRTLKEYRVDALLVGRALMESSNPKDLANHWKQL